MYICLAYVKPVGDTTVFRQIEVDLAHYSHPRDIMIMGDFNGSTGHHSDYVVGDTSKSLPLPADFIEDVEVYRTNCDDRTNPFGGLLFDICNKSAGLRILNGRYRGDSIGFYTSFKHNESSVVDYILASAGVCNRVVNFRVQPYLHLSDHAVLSVTLEQKVY